MESATSASPTATTMHEAATGSGTIADLLPLTVAKNGPRSAVRYKDPSGAWVEKTYSEVGEIVRQLSLGLIELGVEKGDKVSILANTRPEWSYYDFAALTAGATVVPIYQTNSPEECEYVLDNSDAKVVVVEDVEQLEKIRKVRANLPKLEHVVLIEGSADDALSTTALIEKGAGRPDSDWEQRWRSVTPDEICTFIYTSGTTGPPKGCVISHGNYRAMLDMTLGVDILLNDEVTYLYLPLAHSFALLIQLLSFELGATLAYWERDPLKIVPGLAEIKPTYFPSVPRIFEKIYGAITAGVEKEGGLKKRIFWWAIKTGRKVRELEAKGRKPGFLLKRKYAFADQKVLSKVRAVFGGRIRQALSGAAPINPEILELFWAAGVTVVEGWGMTETSTAATISTPAEFKFGTVGKAFDGCQIKIADDGEILVKGANIFQGYYKNDEATRETLVDGWLHTGDIGELDDEGYLSITGRKKDIIITAGGKNITPSNFEAEMKQHPLVSQCVMVGDKRPFLTALITLDPEQAPKFAAEHGLSEDLAALAENDLVRASLQAHLDQINERFARVEQVKKFAILPRDLSQETGEMTPTLKVKRNVVVEKNTAAIEALYASE